MDYIGVLMTITGVLALSVISPGPNFAIVTSTTMTVSRRAGVLTGLGLAAAPFTWAVLAVAGLGLLIAHAGWVYTAVQLAGAAYLIWIGAKMVLGARKSSQVPSGKPGAVGSAAAWKGFLVSMTNPKSVAFYGSIFVVMVPAHAPTWVHVAIVIISAGVSALWYCGLALLFSNSAVRHTFARGKSVIEATMGLFLIGLAAMQHGWSAHGV